VGPNAQTNPLVDQQALFAPKSVIAYTDVTRRAQDSIPGSENIIVNDLLSAIAVEIDRVALNGSGAGNEPTGITAQEGVPQQFIGADGGPPTRAVLAAMEQTIGNANADMGSLGFVTTPNGRYKLRTTEKTTGSGRFLWDDVSGPLGYPAVATNNLPSNLTRGDGTNLSPIIFGNWNDLVIGLWGPIDIMANPYLFTSAGVSRIRAIADVDVQLRHAESFVITPDMVTS